MQKNMKLVEVTLPKPRLLLEDAVFLRAVRDRKDGDCLRYYRREKLLEGLQLLEKKKIPPRTLSKAEEMKTQRMRASLQRAVNEQDYEAVRHWAYMLSNTKTEAREVYVLTTAGAGLIKDGVVRVSIPKTATVKCR